MEQDKIVTRWRDDMRKHMFELFNKDKNLEPQVLLFKLGEPQHNIYTVVLSEVEKEQIPDVMRAMVDKYDPEAYIVFTGAHVLLKKDYDEGVAEIEKAGSIAKTKNAQEVITFIYETKMVTSIEMYEVIRIEGDAVVSDKTLLKSTHLDGIFTGHLNVEKNKPILN